MEVLEKDNINKLFDAGAHFGYSRARRHPKMKEFIFALRNNIEIIDLKRLEDKIKNAEKFIHSLGKEGKYIIFAGTKPNAKEIIKKIGTRLKMPYVSERWLGGTLTNMKVIAGRLSHLKKLEEEEKTNGFQKYVKKERIKKLQEIEKLKKMFDGIRQLNGLPHAMIIVDPVKEKTAFSEAQKKNIPIIALMNVNCNPVGIAYPIPMNDNSFSATSLVLEMFASAYENGVKEKPEILPSEEIEAK